MKTTKQKQKQTIVGLVISIICLLMFTVTMTFAYFTARNSAESTAMQFGTLEISVDNVGVSKEAEHELMPGCTVRLAGEVTLGNSTIDAFVRIKPEVNITTWHGTSLTKTNAQLQLSNLIIGAFEKEVNSTKTGDFIRATGDNTYLYYTGKFAHDATYDFEDESISFKVDENTFGNDWQGCTFTVKITAEAIQADHVNVDMTKTGQALVDAIANAQATGETDSAWSAVSAGESTVETTPLEDLNVGIISGGANSQGASFNGISEMKSLNDIVTTNSSLVSQNNSERTVRVCGNSNTGTTVIVPDYVLNDNGVWKKATSGSLESEYNGGNQNVYKVTEIGYIVGEIDVFYYSKWNFSDYIMDMADASHKALYSDFIVDDDGYEYYEITYEQMMSVGNEFIYNDFKEFLVDINQADNYENALQFILDNMQYYYEMPAFSNSLVSIQLPNTITTISNKAFGGCTNLRDVKFAPNSNVSQFGYGIFDECENIEYTVIDNANYLCDVNNTPITCVSATNYEITSCVIPDTVTTILPRAFAGCNSLTDVTLSKNIKIIGRKAFGESYDDNSKTTIYDTCSSLDGVSCDGTNVKYLGYYDENEDFVPLYLYKGASWSDLEAYIVPESVRVIVGEAFNHCGELTSVTLPSTLVSLGENSFINCGKLENIVVATGNTVYDSRDNCNAVIEIATNKLLAGCNKTIIPNTVSIIGSQAFRGLFSLESIVIPSSVVEICSGAFRFCNDLKSVVFMSNQHLSGVFKGSDRIEGAFSYCNGQLKYYLNEIGESNIIDDEISGTWDDAPQIMM